MIMDMKSSVSDSSSFTESLLSSPRPIRIESCLPKQDYLSVVHDLLAFDSRIQPTFRTVNAVYKYTCHNVDCGFKCGVPHLTLIVKVRGLPDDQIGIELRDAGGIIRNTLPQVPNGRYSYRTWKNSRWHVMRRMFLCLDAYRNNRGTKYIQKCVSKPLHVYIFGGVMGKVLDLQRRFILPQDVCRNKDPECGGVEDDELEPLLKTECEGL